MLKRYKQFFLGFLIASLIFCSITVFADATEIKAFLSDIKIALNGQTVELKDANGNKISPIVYNGATYLPVKPIAEAFGMEVKYNESTNTLEIKNKVVETTTPVTTPVKPIENEPVKEENKDIILKINEPFEDNGFKLTLKKITKSNTVFTFHFYYENNTDKNVTGHSMILAITDNPKYNAGGGLLLYADTQSPVIGGFPANSKDNLIIKIVDNGHFDYIKINNTNVKWQIR